MTKSKTKITKNTQNEKTTKIKEMFTEVPKLEKNQDQGQKSEKKVTNLADLEVARGGGL